jgi:hypothetical protein
MAYGLDPINDCSVGMIAAAHGLGSDPVATGAGGINSYADLVEMPATPVLEQQEVREEASGQSTKESDESTMEDSEGGTVLSEETLISKETLTSKEASSSEEIPLSEKSSSSEAHEVKHEDLYDA